MPIGGFQRTAALSFVEFDFARFSIIGDRPLLLDLAKRGRCAVLDGVLAYYRYHSGQDSRTGPVNERNVIELFSAYRAALREAWSLRTRVRFYAWTGVEALDGYRRLDAKKRSPIRKYIGKCRTARVVLCQFLLYPIGRLLRHADRRIGQLRRILPQSTGSWRRHASHVNAPNQGRRS